MEKKEEILFFLQEHRKELKERFSVRRIGLFGSVLNDAAETGSDVDILVELDQPTFDNYMDLKFFLEDAFGRSVDFSWKTHSADRWILFWQTTLSPASSRSFPKR